MQVAIIGLGDYGKSVALELSRLGGEVLAIDRDPMRVEEIKDIVSQAVVADATDEKTLRSLGVAEVDATVVAIGDLAQSAIATMVLRRIGMARIMVRALSDIHSEVLTAVGASRVINIEQQMGKQIARTLIAPHIMDRSTISENISLMEIRAPQSLIGKRLNETGLREKYRLNLVAIQIREPDIDEHGKRVVKLKTEAAPDASTIIQEGHILIVAGRDEDLDEFIKKG